MTAVALHAVPSPAGEVTFSLATRDDDAAIRALLANNPMPGRIRVRYEREPDYFAGCATMGETQVVVARADERLVGVACRHVYAAAIARARGRRDQGHGCYSGVVYMGQLVIGEDGEEEEVFYPVLCRRCYGETL